MQRLLAFSVILFSELCISFSHSEAFSYISPESNPSASVGERKWSAMLVEEFVGAGCSVNWLSSNHLVLSSKDQIHFSWCLCLSPCEVLQCQWACFLELSSSVGPTCTSTLLRQFPFVSWPSVSTTVLPSLISYCVPHPPSFFLADLSAFFPFKFICQFSKIPGRRRHRDLGSIHQV